MNLELKHLAAYLPYELNILNQWKDLGTLTTLFVSSNFDSCMIRSYDDDEECEICDCVPILRPMSDLVKEIEHKGKKFIPIQVLFEMTLMDGWLSCGKDHLKDFKTHIDDDSFYYYIFKDEDLECSFGYYIYDQSFSFHDGERDHPVENQLSLFQSLFEWHFDVFGLIEQGLAFDYNNFKKELS